MAQASNQNSLDEDLLDEEDEDTQKDRYLTFRLGNEDYGIQIEHVIEIVGIQKITEVPDMPNFVKGVINLRGQVIPVIDIRLRFCMEPRQYDDRTCVIVAKVRDTSLGLIVDTVSEVREIPAANVSAPPQVSMAASSRYIMGLGKVGEEVKILLDVSKLLFEEQLDIIESGAVA